MDAPLLTAGLSHDAQRLLELVAGHGWSDPLSIAAIRREWSISERHIKTLVAKLRLAGWPIGARRVGERRGYYYGTTAEELQESADSMIHQAKRMLLAASRLVGKQRIRELLGQLLIDSEVQG